MSILTMQPNARAVDYGVYSSSYNCTLSCQAIVPLPGSYTESRFGRGHIVTSKAKNSIGEKDVTHLKYEGNAFVNNMGITIFSDGGPSARLPDWLPDSPKYNIPFRDTTLKGAVILHDGASYQWTTGYWNTGKSRWDSIFVMGIFRRGNYYGVVTYVNEPLSLYRRWNMLRCSGYVANRSWTRVSDGYVGASNPNGSYTDMWDWLESIIQPGWKTGNMPSSFFTRALPNYPVSAALTSDSMGLFLDPRVTARNIQFGRILAEVDKSYDDVYDDLCHTAINGFQYFKSNLIMYIKELMSIKTLMPSLSTLRDAVKTMKGKANIYLLWHYGWRLSINDTKTLFRMIYRDLKANKTALRHSRSRIHRSLSTSKSQNQVVCVDSIKVSIYAAADGLRGLESNLRNWDLSFLDLENWWDMIPYSFVLDWFVGVGDWLSSIDTVRAYHTYDIYGSVVSKKRTLLLKSHQLPIELIGELSLCQYERTVLSYLPPPRVNFPKVSPPVNESNIVAGTALIVQRL